MTKQKQKREDVRRVVAYGRVSTDHQAERGHSLEAQRGQLEAYAKVYNLEIVAFEVDAGVSAATLDRPGLTSALTRMSRGEADGMLVIKLDRLTRSVRDLASLVETYFRDGTRYLMSVGEHVDTSSASGRMILNVITSISQWEREAIGERTAAVMQHMKAEGLFTGGWPPFGYKVKDGTLVEDPAEQEVIRQVRELRKSCSLRRIARLIDVNPNTGKPYSASQISRMV